MPRETGAHQPNTIHPLKRLESLLNILPNGGQTLTVLAMPSDPNIWTNYRAINGEINSRAGFFVAERVTTKGALTNTLESISVAARSTVDDEEWALTEIGIDMKPALIFGWRGFTELDVNTPALLSSISLKGKSGENGRTAGLTRFRVLQAIQEVIALSGSDKVKVNEKELMDYTGFSQRVIVSHTDNLAQGGFIDKKTRERTDGKPQATFSVTDKGQVSSEWTAFTTPKQRHIARSSRTFAALSSLKEEGLQLSIPAIKERYLALFPEHALTVNGVAEIISFWAKPEQGFLEREGFSYSNASEISLEPITQAVLVRVLLPLERWAYDPNSVDEINEIRSQLARNPDAFVSAYPEIARSYARYSPFKNKDSEGKTGTAFRIISESGGIAYADLARTMGVSAPAAHKAVAGLLANGVIRREKAASGNKIYLVMNSQE